MPQRRYRFVHIVAIRRDEAAIVRPSHQTQHVCKIAEADAGPLDDAAGVGGAALQQKGVGNARQGLQIREGQRSRALRAD